VRQGRDIVPLVEERRGMNRVHVGHEGTESPARDFRDRDDLGHAFVNGDQPLALRKRGQRAQRT